MKTDYIKIPECINRGVYKIYSRNLAFGAFNGESGFLGIREKFGQRYIFTEYHRDSSETYGTVNPIEYLGLNVPDNIPLVEYLGSQDQITKRAVEFDSPVSEGGKGWYYLDDGKADQNIRPVAVGNPELFNFMDQVEKNHGG